MFIFLLLFILFILDIFANPGFLGVSFYLIVIFPALYLLGLYAKRQKIVVPAGSLLFVFFICLSLISIFGAADKQLAVETVLAYIGGFLIFVIAFNNRTYYEDRIKTYAMFSSVIFVLIFLANHFFSLGLFMTGSSLFYYYGHNQLGNMLILPFLIAFPGPQSLFFLVFILASYSRTSYLSVFLSLIWQIKERYVKNTAAALTIIVVLLVASIAATGGNLFSKTKTLFGSREMYFYYAKEAIMKNPVFGVGSGNFYHAASSLQTNHNENTISSHNIVLDAFAENGIIAGLLFSAFLIYLVKTGRRGRLFYSFIALTFVFLFDFTHRFNSFLVLWFFLAGLVVEDGKTLNLKPWILGLLILACQPILTSQLFYNLKLYKQAQAAYPLNKVNYPMIIVGAIERNDLKEASKYLDVYSSLYGGDYDSALKIARYYEYMHDFDKSLAFYRKTLELRPFLLVADQIVLDKVYALSIHTQNLKEGRQMTGQFLDTILERIPLDHRNKNPIFDYIVDYCYANKLKCYNIEI